MKRRRASIVLADGLYRRAELESIRQGKRVSEVIGEALERYLARAGGRPTTGVVAETWGILKLDRRKFDRLIADEGDVLDA